MNEAADPFFQPWHNVTTLHPLGVMAMIVLGIAMLMVRRRYALITILIMACVCAPAQRLVIMSLDFNLLRGMILFGWLRIALRREYRDLSPKPIDIAVVLWAVTGGVMMTLLYYTADAAINRMGFIFDALGMYFLVRCLIRSWDDLETLARGCAIISIPVAILFLIENATGRNMFSVLGGVPEYTAVRAGKLRCQGAFAHPILAGCFWATLMPVMGALWWRGHTNRLLAIAGLISALIIVLTSSSSTPVIVVIVGGLVCLLFPLRASIRWFALGSVVMLTILHFTMRAPVWHLLARIDLVGGSTGWYRYKLIDEFVAHFPDWWLTGSTSYAEWFQWGLEDVTNQYVIEGLNGGLITLLLFLAVLGLAFFGIAAAWRARPLRTENRIMAWMLFTAFAMHCTAFLAVSYFGQSSYLWYMMLGLAGCAAPALRANERSAKPEVAAWPPRDPARHADLHSRAGRGVWA